MKRKHIIEVNGVEVYAFHGCLVEESKIGQKYTVDVVLETNFSMASESDSLSDTIDYVVIKKIIEEQMAIRQKLIETVAQNIVDQIKGQYQKLYAIEVKVVKHAPPTSGNVDHVATRVEERFNQ